VKQMGNEGHSSHEARLINEWIQAGVIGPVREVYVWTNRPIWPQGVPRPGKPPQESPPVQASASEGALVAQSPSQSQGQPQGQAPRPPSGQRMARGGYGLAGKFGNARTPAQVNKATTRDGRHDLSK